MMSLQRLVRSSPIILARCRHAVVSFSSQPVQESWRAPASTARDPKLAYYFYTLAGQVRHQMDESDTQDIIENYIRRNRTKIVDGLRSKYNEIVKFVNDSIILPPSCILDNEVVLYSSNVDPRIDKDNEARIRIRKELQNFLQDDLGFRDAKVMPSCLWYEIRIPLDSKYSEDPAQVFRTLAQKGFDALGNARR